MPAQFIEAVGGVIESGVSIATTKLTKTSGAGSTFDAGAATNERIAGDGFIEFVPAMVGYRIIGLSADNPGVDRDEIDYGVYMRNDAFGASMMSNGVVEAHLNIAPATLATDTFRIQRVGTAVTVWRNGELVHTFATPSVGSLLVDSSFFDVGCLFDSIRIYDATLKKRLSPTWAASNVTVAVGAIATPKRMTFASPTRMQAGNQLVLVMASQGIDYPVPADEWDQESVVTTVTNKRSYRLLRRKVTGAEPLAYKFDLAVTQNVAGALLVYRELIDGAPYGVAAVDHVATVQGYVPTVARLSVADIVLGVFFQNNPTGGILTQLSNASKRIEVDATVFTQCRITVVDSIGMQPSASVRLGAKVSGLPGGASFGAASFGLPGNSIVGSHHVFSPIALGAIGLPAKGI